MKDDVHKYLCWLNQVKGIGRKGRFSLLRAVGEPNLFREAEGARELYHAPEKQIRFLCGEAFSSEDRAEKAARLLLGARRTEPERVEDGLRRAGIHFSCFLEEDFPQRLRWIPDPPFGIYCKGRMPFSEGRGTGGTADGADVRGGAAAIIGARSASPYGKNQARRFAFALASGGVTVISGMARGIDGIAQRAALDAGGLSFGVLGCGVDVCYPEENRDLYDRLLEQGGILSEYPPGTPPEPKLFPQRNRIISGLSDLVLVIEARKKSGTLITVDMALEQGREVYALPGRVSDHLSDGCNRLIRQGAEAATCPEDILEFFYGMGETKKTVRAVAFNREKPGDPGKEQVSDQEEPEFENLERKTAGLWKDPATDQEDPENDGKEGRTSDLWKEHATDQEDPEINRQEERNLEPRKDRPPASLAEVVLGLLSFDEDRHLERVYEDVKMYYADEKPSLQEGLSLQGIPSPTREPDLQGVPVSRDIPTLQDVNLCLLRLKLFGKVGETAPGYFHKKQAGAPHYSPGIRSFE